jgi:hypothetical protein
LKSAAASDAFLTSLPVREPPLTSVPVSVAFLTSALVSVPLRTSEPLMESAAYELPPRAMKRASVAVTPAYVGWGNRMAGRYGRAPGARTGRSASG